ncbi:hypothetical protein BJ912DRAFT_1065367 [Pholiota molesta]|nr:hypothetical protein BJ912DRAFT_1065367 [Pholiota molesta]
MPFNRDISPSESENSEILQEFKVLSVSVQLAVTVAIPAKDSGTKSTKSSAKPKTKTESKNKEITFTFEDTSDKYLALLSAILSKHGYDKYTPVTSTHRFGIKVAIPPIKTKGAAVDVDSFTDYQEIVTQIFKGKPRKIIIWLSLDDVKKAFKRKDDNTDSEKDKSGTEDSDSNDTKGHIERELSRIRGILEKKYANPTDSGYTYIHDDGERLPLTPAMLLQWARAIYSGDTTHSLPPHTQAFDPQNRQRSLFQKKGDVASASNVAGDLSTVSSIFRDVRAIITNNQASVPTTTALLHPVPTQSTIVPVSSPTKNTPTKLTRYLHFAQDHLGVHNAMDYELRLMNEGYGPDILSEVDNKDLVACGLMAGDAIRLKRGAADWWTSSDAKRSKPAPAIVAQSSLGTESGEQVRYDVRFEKRFVDGGSESIFGSGLRKGPNMRWKEFTWWYYNQVTTLVERVPFGFVPILDPQYLDMNAPPFEVGSQDEPEPGSDGTEVGVVDNMVAAK